MRQFLAHCLFFLAAWTVVIKFVFPLAFAAAEGVALTRYVMLDLWWVVHLWLGAALLRRPPYVYWLALLTSLTEIVIVVTKLVLFFADPVWDIWRTSWLINKCFVLAIFVALLAYLLLAREDLRGPRLGGLPRGRSAPS